MPGLLEITEVRCYYDDDDYSRDNDDIFTVTLSEAITGTAGDDDIITSVWINLSYNGELYILELEENWYIYNRYQVVEDPVLALNLDIVLDNLNTPITYYDTYENALLAAAAVLGDADFNGIIYIDNDGLPLATIYDVAASDSASWDEPNVCKIVCSSFQDSTVLSPTSIVAGAFENWINLPQISFVSVSNDFTFGAGCFKNSSITSIEIPANVSSLGLETFEGCDYLTTVTFEATSTLTSIPGNCFKDCVSLASIEIPASIGELHNECFKDCSALTTVTFEANSNLVTMHSGCFGNSGLTSIEIPASIDAMGSSCFSNCQDLSVAIFEPGTQITSIGPSCFHQAPLTSFTLPNTVTFLGTGCFRAGGRSGSTIHPQTEGHDPTEDGDGVRTLTSFTFEPNSIITALPAGCFYDTGLTSLEIPKSVITIGLFCISWNLNLTSVTFEAGSQLTTIGNYGLYFNNLTSIIIPKSVTDLGYSALNANPTLASVTFEDNSQLTTISARCFEHALGLQSIEIPKGVTVLPTSCFYSCHNLSVVTFEVGSQLTTLNEKCFYNCPIVSITLPPLVTTILGEVFGNTVVSWDRWPDGQVGIAASLLETVNFEGNEIMNIVPGAFNYTNDFSSQTWTVPPAHMHPHGHNNDTHATYLYLTNNYNWIPHAGGVAPTIIFAEATTKGDPYVTPLYGLQYKLPDREACYRLFERGDVFINGLVKEASEQKQQAILNYAQSVYAKAGSTLSVTEASRLLSLDNLLLDGYFFDAFLIYSEEKTLYVDLQNKQFKTNAQEYFAIKQKEEKSIEISNTNLYNNEKYTKVTVNWNHSDFGKMNSYISFYDNPQIDNGISISKAMTTKDCIGLLMYNYKPKLMEIPKLTTLTHKKLHKRLKNAKNKFINKCILLKNEEWRSITTNSVKSIQNKDIKKY